MNIQITATDIKEEILGRVNTILSICRKFLKKKPKKTWTANERHKFLCKHHEWEWVLEYWEQQKELVEFAIMKDEPLILSPIESFLLKEKINFEDKIFLVLHWSNSWKN
jgi:hypothetical protein